MNELFCALCQSPIAPSVETSSCPECSAVYHRDCHEENGGCGTYGCTRVPPPPAQASVAVPAAVWGREMKPCPACGKEIRAAALRCRYCQAVFASIEPMTGEQFEKVRERHTRLGRLRKEVIAVFLGGLIPCTAPLALIVGSLIFLPNQALARHLPPVYRLLAFLGLGLAGLWVILGVAVMLFASGGAG